MKTYNYKNYWVKKGDAAPMPKVSDAKVLRKFRAIKLAFLAFNVVATMAFLFFIIVVLK
ncbi:MAG: hypothetical protein M1364_02270 [Candidatus Marsarchaeota archaeon]|jgi:hypothetical protein|nr:hypothetical protein [Candidatus Marsarchaeota archaeon]